MRLGDALRGVFHRACAAAGVEVHLRRTLERNRQRESARRWESLWSPVLHNYGVSTVIDIGANEGHFAEMIRGASPPVRIISFEPLPTCFVALRRVCERIGNAECHNCALGDAEGETRMFASSFAPSSSMLAMAELHKSEWPASAANAAVMVSLKRLDDVVTPASLAGVVALKIDVQGYEDRVIEVGPSVLRHAKVAVIETSFYPLYDGQPLWGRIYTRMTGLGFRYHGALETCRSRLDGRILQEDALFVRDA